MLKWRDWPKQPMLCVCLLLRNTGLVTPLKWITWNQTPFRVPLLCRHETFKVKTPNLLFNFSETFKIFLSETWAYVVLWWLSVRSKPVLCGLKTLASSAQVTMLYILHSQNVLRQAAAVWSISRGVCSNASYFSPIPNAQSSLISLAC